MNFGLKCPPEIKNFHFLGATSSKINFFQEKCLQFIRYNKLKRFRALQTVFEDTPPVLPCPTYSVIIRTYNHLVQCYLVKHTYTFIVIGLIEQYL